MRIHTDKLTASDLTGNLPDGCSINIMNHGSQSRDHAFEVQLRGWGSRHNRRPNSGKRGGSNSEGMFAATYSDWGHWLAKLFEIDPEMSATYYKNCKDFHKQTFGVYYEPDTTWDLADRVAKLRREGYKVDEACKIVAERALGDQQAAWVVKKAIEGEI